MPAKCRDLHGASFCREICHTNSDRSRVPLFFAFLGVGSMLRSVLPFQAIATSSDAGASWPKMRLLQHGNSPNMSTSPAVAGGLKGGNEFSYPTVLQTSDGWIHVMHGNLDTISTVSR